MYCFVFGGAQSSTYYRDVNLLHFDGLNWAWNPSAIPLVLQGSPPPQPSGRAWFAGGFDKARIRYMIFGGETATGVTDEIWLLEPRIVAGPQINLTWTLVTPTSTDNPVARKKGHVIMLDDFVYILFGGEDGSGQRLNDMWMLYPVGPSGSEQWYWARLPDDGTLPAGRTGAAVFGRPGMMMGHFFGGFTGSYENDFWTYRTLGNSTGRFFQPGLLALGGSLPAGFAGASVVYDERNQRAVVFGGHNGTMPVNILGAIRLYQPVRR
jgi:hypothetical protein